MEPTAAWKHKRTDIWREGKYIDLWSIPHFLSGICVALGLTILGFSASSTAVIGLILLILYEVFEWLVDIEETRANRILDVVVGMASMVPTLLLLPGLFINDIIALFIVITTANSILSWFGWRASKKAASLQETIRKDFVRSRESIRKGRAQLAKRLHIKQKAKLPK